GGRAAPGCAAASGGGGVLCPWPLLPRRFVALSLDPSGGYRRPQAVRTGRIPMARLRLQAAATGLCAVALLVAAASGTRADDPYYKGKRITLLINFAAGGPTDIAGRLFAQY